jgi:phosphohistidine swiveling domain-containing protein
MTGIIIKASTIVTDIGSLASHPAIVAREIGIPCVVGIKKATKILKDGMEIKVEMVEYFKSDVHKKVATILCKTFDPRNNFIG